MKNKFYNIRIEFIFLIIAITIGISFVFITPPFQSPDEPAHFYRSYQISEFKLLEQKQQNQIGGYIPSSIIKTIRNICKQGMEDHPQKKQSVGIIPPLLKAPLNRNSKTFVPFENTATYFPIMYLPQSIGILIGRVLNFSPLMLMYIGRIFNLASWCFITFLAIKIISFGKRLIFLLALAPMALFQAASLSADGVINSLAFLLISIFIKFAFDKRKSVSKKDIILIFTISIALSLCKQSYFIISLLYLLIPIKKIGDKKKYYLIFISIVLSNIFVILAWTYFTKYAICILQYRPNVSIKKQLLYILNDPFKYIQIIGKTFYVYWHNYITEWVGQLGWLDTALPPDSIKLFILMLIFTALTDSKVDINIDINKKIIIFVTLILELILIVSLIYLSYNAVGSPYIAGIQGRYFIPLGPLLGFLFYNRFCCIKGNKIKWVTSAFSVIFLIVTLFVLINRYYLY